MRRATAALGLCVLLAARADAGTQPRKTLAECVEIGLHEQPSLAAATATVDAARERVWQSTAAYLPSLDAGYSAFRRKATASSLTGGPGNTFVTSTPQKFNFYTTGLTLTQILFDFGQNLALIHRSQALAESAAADADTQRDTVIFSVQQSYFGLLAAYRLRDVAEETVRQNGEHLTLAQGRYDVGVAPKFDVTQAQVQLAQAELGQVTARNNVALARETLRNTMGLANPLDFDIVDVLDEPTEAIDDAETLDYAFAHRPELRSLHSQIEAGRQEISALQKDYLPQVAGLGQYTWSGSNYPLQNTWNFGASVNLSIFNGGLTTAQVGEARATVRTLEANEESLRQNVTLEVRQSVLNVREAIESIRVADKLVYQARENVGLAEGRYAAGAGSIIELTDAQASVVSAEANRVQALVNYRIALASLERATAKPFTED